MEGLHSVCKGSISQDITGKEMETAAGRKRPLVRAKKYETY